VEKKNQEIIERVMKYLQERPFACDTLEGISRFWLEFERVDQSVDAIKNVLDILVEKGAVIKIERNGDAPIYKLAIKT
jgi:hypothetical protein